MKAKHFFFLNLKVGFFAFKTLIELLRRFFWIPHEATAGTTVLGAFDPIAEISKVAQEHDIWLHVDVSLEMHLSSKVAFQPIKSQTVTLS